MVAADPIYFIALPLFTAFLLPLLGKLWKPLVRIVPGILFAYLAVMAVVLMTRVSVGHPIITLIAAAKAPWGIDLVFSTFSGFIATLIAVMAFLVWIYSYKFKVVDFEESQKFFLLLMLLVAGSIGVVLTGDIFNMFVFIEITSLSSYGLTAFYRGRNSAEASFKMLLIGAFSSTFLLLGIAILYINTGTLNMAELASKIPDIPMVPKVISFIFIFVALGIEAEMFPMNGWAPDAYSQAPAPVAAAFASILAKAGIYALIRISYTVFDLGGQGGFELLLVMGLLTMVISEIIAMRQTNLRRMLAYSSMGQMGLIMIAFGIGTKEGIYAGLFILFNHAVIKSLLFLSSAYLVYHSPTKDIKELDGYGRKLPLISLLFGLGAFAIVGMPPFSGFWAKLSLLIATADSHLTFVLVTVLSVSVVEIVYYFRVIGRMYFRKSTSESKIQKPAWNASLAMIVLALVIIAVGLHPDLITNILHNAANELADKAGYIHRVLPDLVSLTH